MKPFSIANYSRLNLELEIAGVVYSDEDFTLSRLESIAQESISGELVIKGKYADYTRLKNATGVKLRIITDAAPIDFLEMFAKNPIEWDGAHITVQMDTVPITANVSRTTPNGVAVPYSFGKPYVKVPRVTTSFKGTVTENQFSLSKANLMGLVDMYMDVQPTIAGLARGGLTTGTAVGTAAGQTGWLVLPHQSFFVNKDLTLEPLARFHAEVDRLKELAPSKANLLDELAMLPYWEGVGNADTYQYIPVYVNKNKYTWMDNLGMPPPLSAYSMLEANNSNDGIGAAWDASSEPYTPRPLYAVSMPNSILVYKNSKLGTPSLSVSLTRAKLSELNTYYRGLCNLILEAPDTLAVDLGDEPIAEVSIDVKGLTVTGSYSGGEIAVTSRAPERVSWTISPDPSNQTSVIVSGVDLTERDLVGMYLLVDSDIEVFATQLEPISHYWAGEPIAADGNPAEHVAMTPPNHRGGLRVVAQSGNTLTLSGLPVQAVNEALYGDSDSYWELPEKYYWEFPKSHLELGVVRSGTVLAVSSTLEGALYSGQDSFQLGNYNWSNPNEVSKWDGSSEFQTFFEAGGEGADDLVKMPAFLFLYDQHSWERGAVFINSSDPTLGINNHAGYRYIENQTTSSFYNSIRTMWRDSPETHTQKLIAHAFTYEEAEYTWELNAGDTVTLLGTEEDVFIVDNRPNMAVLGVKCRVGDAYLVVPPAFYIVLPSYELEGEAVTALKIYGGLQEAGLSEDLIVQVDTLQASLGSMLSALAGEIGKAYTEEPAFPSESVPAYTVYGRSDVLTIAKAMVTESRGAFILTVDTLQAVYLNTPPTVAAYTFTLDNIESFKVHTSDSLDLIVDTTFTWENFRAVDNTALVVLDPQPESSKGKTEIDIEVFQDKANSLAFAKWHVHREGRDWERVQIIGFATELHIEALDYVSVDIGGGAMDGLVERMSYSAESGEAVFDILLNTNGYTLWDIGQDVIAPMLTTIADAATYNPPVIGGPIHGG